MSEPVKVRAHNQAQCKDCSLAPLCLPLSLNLEDMDALEEIVKRGNEAKFEQNEHLLKLLLATVGTRLVEANPNDQVWGIGLAENHPDARDPKRWRGQNKLGDILTELRDRLTVASQGAGT